MDNIIKFNYHTHSSLCDGKNTLEEMAEAAFARGFSTLGFSGHCYTAYDESYCMSRQGTEEYLREVDRLRRKYEGSMEILCGIEQDFGSDEPVSDYDYVIGSVHAMFPFADENSEDNFHGFDRSRYFYVDWNLDCIREAVDSYFGGDPYAFCEHYYKMVSMLPQVTKCSVIGHFDLLTKFSEQDEWFSPSHPRYLKSCKNALRELVRQNMVFEINTGAMAKGLRTSPYPAAFILEEICRLGGSIMINSDSHQADTIDYGFSQALELVRSCGFTSVKKITKEGFVDVPV